MARKLDRSVRMVRAAEELLALVGEESTERDTFLLAELNAAVTYVQRAAKAYAREKAQHGPRYAGTVYYSDPQV